MSVMTIEQLRALLPAITLLVRCPLLSQKSRLGCHVETTGTVCLTYDPELKLPDVKTTPKFPRKHFPVKVASASCYFYCVKVLSFHFPFSQKENQFYT